MFLGIQVLMYWKSYFSRNWFFSLSTYEVTEGTDMLTKRSTPVDQNVESESMDSKLSVAIFGASRTFLRTQECSVYEKKSKIYRTHEKEYLWLVSCAIYDVNKKYFWWRDSSYEPCKNSSWRTPRSQNSILCILRSEKWLDWYISSFTYYYRWHVQRS